MLKELANKFSLNGSEDKIRRLINSLRVGVLVMGPYNEVLFNNEVALHMLGLTEDELYAREKVRKGWKIVYEDGSEIPCSAYPVPVAISTKKPVSNVVMGVCRPDTNDKIWLLVNAEPVLNEKDEIKEIVCSFSDITKSKESEEKLNWLYQSLEIRAIELATSNKELERFAYIATHDLQEPLRMVSSFTQLLKKKYEDQLDSQAAEYINFAVEGASRMKSLIRDLSEYTNFYSNKEVFSLVDMNDILRKAIGSFEQQLKEIGANLIIPEMPSLLVKPSLMIQLFENLIGNAYKYRSNRKLQIIIECLEGKDHYQFSVSDNGIGIEEDYWDKIFILFKRLHNNNNTYSGTGVGLTVCKKITELHQGSIWVKSEKGKGSTFYFTISKQKPAESE